MNNDPRSLTRRPSRTIPATVLAIALVVLGGVGLWLLGTHVVTGQWPHQAHATMTTIASTHLASAAVVTAACVLAVIGVLLLLLALWPGQPRRVAVLADEIPGETVMTRRDLASLIQHRVEQVDGVDSVKVTASRRRADLRVGSVLGNTEPLHSAVQAAAEDALLQLKPAAGIRPRVRLRRT
ncbi:MAG: DUF6286 domain-containing protein [Corynebacterium sp.]|uniref:DUF6286 domain-containing protein n=1 Tax=Corynebacterium sp. TaxID=1720 RepID=UPI0026DD5E17|nr:DUF6286 domain-containing protein [Corynebacterium sp.]MDO5099371.1 DUF6286 domain-containing protein [Corynebacterium sp.]